MKDTFSVILLIVTFFLIGFFVGKEYVAPEVKTITRTDTVKVSYADTVYKFKSKIKRTLVRDTVAYRDSFYVHDTLYVSYFSPFRLGSDTLNCTGNVYFDMKRFSFDNVKFKYPSRAIYQTKFITKTNWTWTIIGTAAGIITGVILMK